jgi:hypothetical protein
MKVWFRKELPMSWNNLSERSKAYIDRYIRNTSKTREEAMQEKLVQEVINEYEYGNKERMIFA